MKNWPFIRNWNYTVVYRVVIAVVIVFITIKILILPREGNISDKTFRKGVTDSSQKILNNLETLQNGINDYKKSTDTRFTQMSLKQATTNEEMWENIWAMNTKVDTFDDITRANREDKLQKILSDIHATLQGLSSQSVERSQMTNVVKSPLVKSTDILTGTGEEITLLENIDGKPCPHFPVSEDSQKKRRKRFLWIFPTCW